MILKDAVSPFILVHKRQRQFTGPRAGTIDPGADIDLSHLGPGRLDPVTDSKEPADNGLS